MTGLPWTARFSSRMLFLSLLVGLFIGLATPVTCFFVQSQQLRLGADGLGLDVARRLKETLGTGELTPEQGKTLMPLLDSMDARDISCVRVISQDDLLIGSRSFGASPWLWTTGTAPLVHNDRVLGRVEVDRRLDGLVVTCLWMGLVFGVLGGGVAVLLYRVPTGMVRQANDQERLTVRRFEDEVIEHREKEKHLGVLLREKEVLLLEVHHRVRNSLQLISSMISLKARRTESQEAKGLLENIRYKVHTVAAVHEQLYRSSNFESVGMQAYLESLFSPEANDATPGEAVVESRVRAQGVQLPLRVAMSVGLIVSELVMNSRKYAFVGRSRGTIEVDLTRDGRQLSLTVADDGVGLDERALATDKRLGYLLIESLVAPLAGTLAVESRSGVTVRIGLKIPEGPAPQDEG